MDEIRQIRYLIPPIFLVLSLLIGGYLDDDNALRDLRRLVSTPAQSSVVSPTLGVPPEVGTLSVVLTLLAGTAVVIAGGVLVGAVARLLLVGLAFAVQLVLCVKERIRPPDANDALVVFWEVCQRRSYFHRIQKKCAPYNLQDRGGGVPDALLSKYHYYAAVTFDHENLFKDAGGLHQWLARRWSGFLVSFNSAVALMFALVLGWWGLRIASPLWSWGVTVVFTLLLANAGISWWQAQTMHEFHSYRP